MKMNKKKIIIYIIVAFVLGWILQICASLCALQGKSGMFQVLLSLAMFAPLLAVLNAKIPLKGMRWRPKLKGKIKYYLAAWFGPVIFTVLGAALYYVVFPNRFDMTGAYIMSMYGSEVVEQMEAAGLSMGLYAVVTLVQCVTYAPAFNGIFALGEEAGWRGAMYPMLKNRFGVRKGRIIGGLIWGAWHWPVMLLAGYEYGLYYWGAPFLGMALFCVCTVVLGTLLDVLYEKTNCILVPAVAHGAFNAAATAPVLFLNPIYANQMILGPAPHGIVSMIPMLIVAVIILISKNKPSEKQVNEVIGE